MINDLPAGVKMLIFSKLENKEFANVSLVNREWNMLSQAYPVLLSRYRDINLSKDKRDILFNKILETLGTNNLNVNQILDVCYYTKAYFAMMTRQLELSVHSNIDAANLISQVYSVMSKPLHQIQGKEELKSQLQQTRMLLDDLLTHNPTLICYNAQREIQAFKLLCPFAFEVLSFELAAGAPQLQRIERMINMMDIALEFLDCKDTNCSLGHFILSKPGFPQMLLANQQQDDLIFAGYYVLGDMCHESLKLNSDDDLQLLARLGLTPTFHQMRTTQAAKIFNSPQINAMLNARAQQLGLGTNIENIQGLLVDSFCPNGLLSSIRINALQMSARPTLSNIQEVIYGEQSLIPEEIRLEIIGRRAAVRQVLVPDLSVKRDTSHNNVVVDDPEEQSPAPKRKKRQ